MHLTGCILHHCQHHVSGHPPALEPYSGIPAYHLLRLSGLYEMKTERERLFKRLNERFVKAFATYHLLKDDDYVLVGLSGGKDSLLLTELLGKRARIEHPRFRIEAVHVRMENIKYETSTDYLQEFCSQHGVKLHLITTRFEESDKKPPCFLCSWYRRKQLFNIAQELGCNKIALGHHRDDIIHTMLMNLVFQGRFGTMPALLRMRKMPLSIIRPLCMIDEADIHKYAALSGYQKLIKQCPHEHETFRTGIAKLYAEMERMNPETRFSIWKALESEGKLLEEY
jgi:tRNA(Ile)-lysidine synthase TilS/MesJ